MVARALGCFCVFFLLVFLVPGPLKTLSHLSSMAFRVEGLEDPNIVSLLITANILLPQRLVKRNNVGAFKPAG